MSELFFSLAKSLICLVGTFNKKQINRQPRAGGEGGLLFIILLLPYMCYFIGQDSKKERPRTKGRENSREAKTIFLLACMLAPSTYLFIYVHKRYIPIWNQPQQFSLYSTILHSLHNSTLTKRHLFYTYNIHL